VKQYVRYYATLVGLFIVVSRGTDAGALLKAGAQGASDFTKSLQGRS
jgi:hypothetical protein